MTITFSGLASGLDTQTIMNSLMKIERIPLDQLSAQQASVTQAKTQMSSFLSKVTAVRTAAASLSDPAGFRSLTASSTDSGVVATVAGGAQPGSFSVQVMSLAHEQRTTSNAQSSSTDPLSQSGSITFQIGAGTPVTVAVDSNDSLAAIADSINQSGARITASVIYDGSQYRLAIRGQDSGAANAITFTESGVSLGLDDPANTNQVASDARVKIDDVEITRSSNLIQGAIPGVSLSLRKEMTSAGKVAIDSDPGALATKIQSFVSAYNDMVASAHSIAGYGNTKASNSLLQSDSAVRSTLDRLSRVLGSSVAGSSGRYTTLSSAGLTSNSDGTLKLDTAKLSTAMAADPTGVARLFTTDASIGATGAMKSLLSAVDALTTGTNSAVGGRISALGKQSERLTESYTRLSLRIDAYQTALQNRFIALETMMSNINAQSSAYESLTNYTSTLKSSSSDK